jgi:two-component system, OmpR family, sensor histidine kinase TctE
MAEEVAPAVIDRHLPREGLAQRTHATGRKTLRRQLLIWLFWPLMMLWSVSSVIDYDIANRFVNLAYDRALLETALDIGRQVKVLNDRVYVDLPEIAVQMLQTRQSGRIYYLVTGPNSEYVTGEPDLPPPPDPFSGRVNYYDEEYRGQPMRIVTLYLPLETGRQDGTVMVQVAENREGRDDFARQILLRMVLPQALLIVAAALTLWLGVGRGLAPLGTLRREIESRSHRDLSALSDREAPVEVQPLIRAMNDLLERLALAIAAQQRFIADAAHQLRTPIAGLKTQTELALRQTPPCDAQDTLRQLRAATTRTTRLVNQLLSLARAEPSMNRTRTWGTIDLNALAKEATAEWVPRALERRVDLGFDAQSERVEIQGDAFLLREMLNNVLDNAIRYSAAGGQVTVRVSQRGAHPVVSVEDDGPGIAPAERERVFERFYRVLGTGAEGCGLGLAIVREIALSHGAEVELGPGPDGRGTLVSVVFPAPGLPASRGGDGLVNP